MTIDTPFIVGVSGGSAAGKSTVARLLADSLNEFDPAVIGVDMYFFDRSGLSPSKRARLNFDSPEALDFETLAVDLQRLKSGEKVYIPAYDYATHVSIPKATLTNPSRLIIVEGILLFYPPAVQPMLDCKIFVDASREERLRRRVERDTAERGRTRESVIRQFNETVEPGFAKYIEPGRAGVQFTLNWNRWNFDELHIIAQRIKGLMV